MPRATPPRRPYPDLPRAPALPDLTPPPPSPHRRPHTATATAHNRPPDAAPQDPTTATAAEPSPPPAPVAPSAQTPQVAAPPAVPQGTKNTAHRFTEQKRQAFLEAYESGHSVSASCEIAGISRVTVYRTVRTDPQFAAAFRAATELNTDACEDRLLQMATEAKVPGNVVALFGILKARRPERWRDQVSLQHAATVDFAATFAEAMRRVSGGESQTESRPRDAVH